MKKKSKNLFIFPALSIFLMVFFVCAEVHAKIVINEIMTGDSVSSKDEFIELYNTENVFMVLDKYKLTKKTASGSESNLVSSAKFAGTIPAEGYFVIAHPDFAGAINADLSYSGASYSIADNNSVSLYDASGKVIDTIGFGTASIFENAAAVNPEEGKSIGRIEGEDSGDNSKDFFILKNTSPGEKNIKGEIVVSENEIEVDIDENVYVNIYAYFEISGLPEKAKVVWTFGDGHRSYLQKTKHKYFTTGKYEGSVKYPENGRTVVQNFTIEVGEVPHPEVKIISINANPKGSDADNETITVQNKSKKKINLNGWSIATGWKKLINHPIKEDFEIKAGKKKEITREFSKFTLNNKKTKIELRYPDGEVAYDVKYKKKNESIAEGEIYEKGKNRKWVWVGKEESSKGKVADKESVESTTNNVSSINSNSNANVQRSNQNIADEDAGKQTVWKKEILLSKAAPVLGFKNVELEPYAPGAETMKEIDAVYHFVPESQVQQHYAIVFAEKISLKINTQLNLFLNYFLK